jgi:hypothetical protein
MSVATYRGIVESDHVRLLDAPALPPRTQVYVVVPEVAERSARIWSPRLADPAQSADFIMDVADIEDSPDGEL